MRRLLPTPTDPISPAEAFADPDRRRHEGRPWVGICMVASVDGATVVGGRSGGLSNPTDAAVLRALRGQADVVLVGAGTVRAERYGPPSKAGLTIGVVSSRGAGLDFGSELFRSGAGFVVTAQDAPELPVRTVRAGVGRVELAGVLEQLDADFVHVEGGPTLNGALLDAGLVDEVNLTVSPRLAGGSAPRAFAGGAETDRSLTLVHVLEEDGYLFTRWRRRD